MGDIEEVEALQGAQSHASNRRLSKAVSMVKMVQIQAPDAYMQSEESLGLGGVMSRGMEFVSEEDQLLEKIAKGKVEEPKGGHSKIQPADQVASAPISRISKSGTLGRFKTWWETDQSDDGFEVESRFPDTPDRCSFSFAELGLTVAKSKKVLHGVTGEIRHSQMVAVMGPSGAGKTTFLNTLCGRAFYGKVSGRLEINGKQGHVHDIHSEVGFVPQDDTVHEDLTVYENLHFSSSTRLPAKTSAQKRLKLVEEALRSLQLNGVRNSIVGSVARRGVSGGQRKRVNIGVEMAADPLVLFLDEPTSGLDSTSSQVVLSALKEMSLAGRTVIAVIHQPRFSIFSMFDSVLLLGLGGRTVYQGPTAKALAYFNLIGFDMPSNENPADFMMDVIAGMVHNRNDSNFHPAKLVQCWQQSKHTVKSMDAQLEVNERYFHTRQRLFLSKLFDLMDETDGQKQGSLNETQVKCMIYELDSFGYLEKHLMHALKKFVKNHFATKNLLGEAKDRVGTALKIQGNLTKPMFEEFLMQPVMVRVNVSQDGGKELEYETGHISKRLSVSASAQLLIISKRALIKMWRNKLGIILDLFIICGAALAAGIMMGKYKAIEAPIKNSFALTLFGTFSMLGALPVYGKDRTLFFREASTINRMSWFWACNVLALVLDIIRPVLFAGIYHSVTVAPASLSTHIKIYLCTSWASSGLGQSISVLFPQSVDKLACSVVGIICGAFLAGAEPTLKEMRNYESPFMIYFAGGSYARWAAETLAVNDLLSGHFGYEPVAYYQRFDYQCGYGAGIPTDLSAWARNATMAGCKTQTPCEFSKLEATVAFPCVTNLHNLLIMGAVYRVFTMLLVLFTHRRKQNLPTLVDYLERCFRGRAAKVESIHMDENSKEAW